MNLPLERWYLSAAYEPIIRRVAIVLSFAGKGCGWGWMLCCIRLELFQEGVQEKTGAIPTSHRMSPASPVAEATASRAIPRSKHALDLAKDTGSSVVTWTKTKDRYHLS